MQQCAKKTACKQISMALQYIQSTCEDLKDTQKCTFLRNTNVNRMYTDFVYVFRKSLKLNQKTEYSHDMDGVAIGRHMWEVSLEV